MKMRLAPLARLAFVLALVASLLLLLGNCFTLPVTAQVIGGYAVDLNGTNAHVQINPNATLTLTNRVTLEAWIYPIEGKCQTILSRGDGGANSDYLLEVGYDGVTCGNMKIGFFCAGTWDFSSSVVASNAWSHVAVTYDGANKVFYINGVRDSSAARPGVINQTGTPIYIGRQGTVCNCNFFHGRIDEVRIWNTVRTGTEIRDSQVNFPGAGPGLVACYRFNEGSGPTVVDFTGNGNMGILTNGAAWIDVHPYVAGASALSFDGVNDYVLVLTNNFPALPQLTLEAWVYPTDEVCKNTILSRGDGNNAQTDFILQLGYDGSGCSGRNLAFFGAGFWDASISPIPSNTWTHVAVTYDGSYKRFYINGVLDATSPLRSGGLYQSGLPLFIGRQGSACNCNFFKGMMDEVRIWNIARSQFLISYFKNAPLPSPRGIPPNLVASFHLDEAAGALTFDPTNGYSAGLSNGPVWVNSTAPIVGLADAEARLASDITGNSAVLAGYVDPHLEPTAVWFEYGTSSSDYSNSTGPTNVPAVNYIVPVNIPISGLALSTTYYYRVAALNHYGTTRSYPGILRTLGPPDVQAITLYPPSSDILELHGTVDPRSSETRWYAEYGLNTSYGSTTSTGILYYAANVTATFSTLPARTYHSRLVASNIFGTSYSSDLSFLTPPDLPTVVSASISQLTSNSVTLNAVVNPNGASTTVYFQLSPLPGGGIGGTVGVRNAGSGVDDIGLSVSVSDLAPGTRYQYYVQASNLRGALNGGGLSFTPPAVNTTAVDQVASAHATLHGSVYPNSWPTLAWFEYGPTQAYGLSTPPVDVGSGSSWVASSAVLSNLTPGAFYNFRAAISNILGVNYGGNLTFQTAARAGIGGISRQTNGQYLLQFNGSTGITYTLQVSTNLLQWVDVTNLSAGSNGLFNYVDPRTAAPATFYRLANP